MKNALRLAAFTLLFLAGLAAVRAAAFALFVQPAPPRATKAPAPAPTGPRSIGRLEYAGKPVSGALVNGVRTDASGAWNAPCLGDECCVEVRADGFLPASACGSPPVLRPAITLNGDREDLACACGMSACDAGSCDGPTCVCPAEATGLIGVGPVTTGLAGDREGDRVRLLPGTASVTLPSPCEEAGLARVAPAALARVQPWTGLAAGRYLVRGGTCFADVGPFDLADGEAKIVRPSGPPAEETEEGGE